MIRECSWNDPQKMKGLSRRGKAVMLNNYDKVYVPHSKIDSRANRSPCGLPYQREKPRYSVRQASQRRPITIIIIRFKIKTKKWDADSRKI